MKKKKKTKIGRRNKRTRKEHWLASSKIAKFRTVTTYNPNSPRSVQIKKQQLDFRILGTNEKERKREGLGGEENAVSIFGVYINWIDINMVGLGMEIGECLKTVKL